MLRRGDVLPSFGVTLVALSLITTLLILTVVSNIVLSLGMVGALSIVRFRHRREGAMDIAFLFWAIAVGIVLAAGMIPLAVFGSVVIGIFLLIFANKKSHLNPYIVVLRCEGHESELAATDFLKKQVQRMVIKSKTAQKGSVELNVEIRMKDDNTDFVNILFRDERCHQRGSCQLQRRLHGIRREADHVNA